MDQTRASSAEPVDGDVIGQSAARKLGFIAVCLLLIPIGGVMAWAWWTEFPLGTKRLNFYAGIIGVFMFVVGVIGVPVSIASMFVRTRLILGRDRLQIVVGKKRVSMQIPYKNIARIDSGKDDIIGRFIGFELYDAADPDTFHVGSEDVRQMYGWHYRLSDDSWTIPLEQIYSRLGEKIKGA